MPTPDLHARVAAAIFARLETANPASWTPPWHGVDPMPRNARTGRRYRGLNVLALWCTGQSQGYNDARGATYGSGRHSAHRFVEPSAARWSCSTRTFPFSACAKAGDADPPDGAPFVAPPPTSSIPPSSMALHRLTPLPTGRRPHFFFTHTLDRPDLARRLVRQAYRMRCLGMGPHQLPPNRPTGIVAPPQRWEARQLDRRG